MKIVKTDKIRIFIATFLLLGIVGVGAYSFYGKPVEIFGATVCYPQDGCTGTATTPGLNEILIGDGNGVYSVSPITNFIGENIFKQTNGTTVEATSTDQGIGLKLDYFIATSTTASSTFAGDVEITGNLEVTGTLFAPMNIVVTGLTQGSILFAGATSNITQDNSNFFWDDSNNRLGIGNTAPTNKLNVQGDIVGQYFIATSTTADTNLHDTLYVDSSAGSVGIGIASPGAKLHVSGGDILLDNGFAIQAKKANTAIKDILELDSSDFTNIYGMNVGGTIRFLDRDSIVLGTFVGSDFSVGTTTNTNARLNVQTSGTDDILNLFETGGAEVFTVLENGSVGIGTASPTNNLHIYSSTAGVNFYVESDQSDANQNLDRADVNSDARIRFRTAGTVNFDVGLADDGDSNFYIGSQNFGNKWLTVNSSTGAFTLASGATITDSTDLVIAANGANRNITVQPSGSGNFFSISNTNNARGLVMRNETNGTAATARIQVDIGSSGTNVAGHFQAVANSYTTSNFTVADSIQIFARTSASAGLYLGTESTAPVVFGTNNAEIARFSGANLGIGTSSPSELLSVQGDVSFSLGDFFRSFFYDASAGLLTVYSLIAEIFELPNGTSNTFTAVGQTYFDTSANQLVLATSTASGAVIGQELKTIWATTASSTVDSLTFPPKHYGFTVREWWCQTDTGQLTLTDSNGASVVCTATRPTSGTTTSSTYAKGGDFALTTSAKNDSPTEFYINVVGTITRE